MRLRKSGDEWAKCNDPALPQPPAALRYVGPRRIQAHVERHQAALRLDQSPHVAGLPRMAHGRQSDACAEVGGVAV